MRDGESERQFHSHTTNSIAAVMLPCRTSLIMHLTLIVVVANLCNLSLAVRNKGLDQDEPDDDDAGFPAHCYDAELENELGPQTLAQWKTDANRMFERGSFTVIIHGVIGAGKSKLIERLCGMGRGDISDVTDDGGHTSSAACYDHLQNNEGTKTIHVIDTPGFGEKVIQNPAPGQSKFKRQAMVLSGLDDAAITGGRRSREGAPVKRIYFMVDCNKDRNRFPETLNENLGAMKTVYGDVLAHILVFVVSKCDLMMSNPLFQRREFIDFRTKLCEIYKRVFEMELANPHHRIIFISPNLMKKISTSKGSMRNLVDDLVRASESEHAFTKAISENLMMPEVRKVEDAYMKHKASIEENKALAASLKTKANAELGVGIAFSVVSGLAAGVAGLAAKFGKVGKFIADIGPLLKAVNAIKNHTKMAALAEASAMIIAVSLDISGSIKKNDLESVTTGITALVELSPEFEKAIAKMYGKAL